MKFKMIFKNIIVLILINYTLGLLFSDLQCNFTMYMLNYFNHNGRYLNEININKNMYNESDLKIYGISIQNHAEIVMVMLDALRKYNIKNCTNYFSKELMTLNLYFNNVSGYTDMLATNEEGKIDLSDLKSSMLEGYIILHEFISVQLENFIQNVCKDVSYDIVFITCPDYNESGRYTLENLNLSTNKLKNRLLQTDELQNITEPNIEMLRNSFIYKVFKLTYNIGEYIDFLPKKILLYDFMMNGQQVSERDLLSGSQSRYYQITNNNRPKCVLDILRFAPLTINCKGGSQVTLFDIFRFVKYSFYRLDIQSFHTLVMTATFRPIGLLIKYYIKVLSGSMIIYNFNFSNGIAKTFYNNMIIIGIRTIEYLREFIAMDIFGTDPTKFFNIIFSKFNILIRNFINMSTNEYFVIVSDISILLNKFLNQNRIENTISHDDITTGNIDNFYTELINYLEHAKEYILELKNNLQYFNAIKITFSIDVWLRNKAYILHPSTIENMSLNNNLKISFKMTNKQLDNYLFNYIGL
ncbi:uncharacterized protein LOC126907946 [Daktulosphaira vitifoliae]|uniref:uncharacterized protein LOC126907946 n=1 Tax=Daktulosphaira vitifoliae TaxID=58002 RepID=UPI0021A9EE63|nr:uncharacterized protein LOC126907946 [Daktulosphaira vitifoliae]